MAFEFRVIRIFNTTMNPAKPYRLESGVMTEKDVNKRLKFLKENEGRLEREYQEWLAT